ATAIEIDDGSSGCVFETSRAAGIVKRDSRAGGLDTVIDLRRGGHEAISSEADAGTQHRAGELENIGVTPDAWELTFHLRRGDKSAHDSAIDGDVHVGSGNNHGLIVSHLDGSSAGRNVCGQSCGSLHCCKRYIRSGFPCGKRASPQ